MKALSHLLTVNEHRRQVRRLCFKAGLYWQGLTHDLSNILRRSSSSGQNITRETGARTTPRESRRAFPRPGSTTRAGTNTILSIGWITASAIPSASRGCGCR